MQSQSPLKVRPLESPVPAGVPRRFGVGALLLLVAFFSVLFAVMRCLNFNPAAWIVISVLFVGVAVGQALLFGGNKPRAASLLVGAVLFPLEMAGLDLYYGGGFDACGMVCSAFGGAVFGYACGALTAGVFLLVNRLSGDRWETGPAIELQPLGEPDIDTLLAWAGRLRLWAPESSPEGSAASLLDRDRLGRCLQQAAGSEPGLLMLKAVRQDSGRMVGYVELGEIDRPQGRAVIQLVLAGPAESDRGTLSMAILQAALTLAFEELGLDRVDAALPASDWSAASCFSRLGFRSMWMILGPDYREGGYETREVVRMSRLEWLRRHRPRGQTTDDEAAEQRE